MSRILFIRYKKTAGKIFEGGEQCSQRNFDLLSSLPEVEGVDTVYIHDETIHRSRLRYAAGAVWFPFGYFFGLSPRRVQSIVRQAKEGYDMVFIDRSVFGRLAFALKQGGYSGRVVCFFHNVEDRYFDDKLPRRLPFRGVVLRCVRSNDRMACQYADSIVALNERDSSALQQLYGRSADMLVPIAFRDVYQRDAYPEAMTRPRPRCLCIGSYFPANCEGIEWFCREVLPHVAIDFEVVGKGMDRLRENYAIPADVRITANVPDLQPCFEEADILILPIFKGSGMKVKTCESLMYGKNIIASDEAFEGYELDYNQVGARCTTAADFIQAIQSFIDHPRPRFNAYSRAVFLEKYSYDKAQERFRSLVVR